MAQYVDCYCLVDFRSEDLISRFIEKLMPNRLKASVNYPIPQYSDKPNIVYSDEIDIIKYLESNKNEVYSIYWKNTDKLNPFKHLMLFYTNDGKTIFGISLTGNNPKDSNVTQSFLLMKETLKSEFGCITVEEPPPFNSAEFKRFCSQRWSQINMDSL